jgi:hypothetical protein
MTATAHMLVGGAMAASFPNPALGLTLAAASHPLMDIIPHWDCCLNWRKKTKTKLFIEASLDVIIGFSLSYLLFGQFINFWYFIACLAASLIWDIFEVPYWLLDWRFPPFGWFYKIQSKMQGKLQLPWGIITQLVTVAIVFYLI